MMTLSLMYAFLFLLSNPLKRMNSILLMMLGKKRSSFLFVSLRAIKLNTLRDSIVYIEIKYCCISLLQLLKNMSTVIQRPCSKRGANTFDVSALVQN